MIAFDSDTPAEIWVNMYNFAQDYLYSRLSYLHFRLNHSLYSDSDLDPHLNCQRNKA